jgi:hypothetical protein
MDRSRMPARLFRAGQEPPSDESGEISAQEAWDRMWQMTVDLWSFMEGWPDGFVPPFRRDVVRIIRPSDRPLPPSSSASIDR